MHVLEAIFFSYKISSVIQQVYVKYFLYFLAT